MTVNTAKSDATNIASGGAGTMGHFAEVLTKGKADAALAASLFHDRKLGIGERKSFLIDHKVVVRPIPH